jgi:hypothetical protein
VEKKKYNEEFNFVLFSSCYWDEQMMENEMVGTSRPKREMKNAYKILVD